MADVIVNTDAIDDLKAHLDAVQRPLLSRLGERGQQLLIREAPERSGNLKKGVGAPEYDFEKMTALLTVSASRDSSGLFPHLTQAQVIGKDGKVKKTAILRPSPAYNYAEVVARGNKKATLSPTHAKAFLIPVATRPTDEEYLLIGGQAYVLRRTKKGMKANPFDERAADRLQRESPAIAEAVLREFV